MKTSIFTGVCTALVTPFFDNKINYPMLQVLLKRQIDAGVEAIVIAGTTGEASTLTDKEKADLFRISKDIVGNHCKIIAGTGSNATEHTVILSQIAEEAGVDGLLIVAPYYNKPNNEGLCAHYRKVANSVNLPIIMYNVPTRTGVDIPISVYRELSAVKNIAGTKEAGKDIIKHARILNACGQDFTVWAGNDEQIVASVSLGGSGVISVLSNVMPQETVAMTNAALAGDFETAIEIQKHVLPLIDLLFADTNPIPVKHIMSCIGYDCGTCRLPLTAPNTDLINKIKTYL